MPNYIKEVYDLEGGYPNVNNTHSVWCKNSLKWAKNPKAKPISLDTWLNYDIHDSFEG